MSSASMLYIMSFGKLEGDSSDENIAYMLQQDEAPGKGPPGGRPRSAAPPPPRGAPAAPLQRSDRSAGAPRLPFPPPGGGGEGRSKACAHRAPTCKQTWV